jgi:hypothetical protein
MNPVLTRYQRGNRDGLTSLAAELDLLVLSVEAEIQWWEDSKPRRASIEDTIGRLASHSYQLQKIAKLARRRSEALPEDPEDG